MQRVFVSVYIGAVSDAQIGKGGGGVHWSKVVNSAREINVRGFSRLFSRRSSCGFKRFTFLVYGYIGKGCTPADRGDLVEMVAICIAIQPPSSPCIALHFVPRQPID